MESLLQKPQDPLDIDIDQVAKSFSDLLKYPNLSSAHFLEDPSSEFLNVHTQWTFVDVIGKEKPSFIQQYSILKSSIATGLPIISASTPIPYANV
jgi:hypothetical protein